MDKALHKSTDPDLDGALVAIIDLDVVNGQKALVLQPDKTWKEFSGVRAELPEVQFVGSPEEIANELQKLRDEAPELTEWGHVLFHSHSVGVKGVGTVRYYARVLIWNQRREKAGPLPCVKWVVLKNITSALCHMIRCAESSLLKIVGDTAVEELKRAEDEMIFADIENCLRLARDLRGDRKRRQENEQG